MIKTVEIDTKKENEMIDIDNEIKMALKESGLREGLAHIQSLHTTTSIIVIENEDPELKKDFFAFWDKTIEKGVWKHDKNCPRVNAHAHIKSSIMNPGVTVPFLDGDLVLGKYQGICFVEFDGPQKRRFSISIVGK